LIRAQAVQAAATFVYASAVLPFQSEIEFDPAPDPSRDEQFFKSIPSHAGIFLIETRKSGSAAPSRPYLARTADLRRAAERLLRAPDATSKRLNLRDVAAVFRYRCTGSRLEQLLAMYQRAREIFPRRYRDFLRLRPPAMLKINLRSSYPRCYVTRRIFSDGGLYVGPFASRRIAENFSGRFLELFKIRRCQIKIRRDPAFPGCIYSEMKMCLAPCFAGCTKEEYEAEVAVTAETLASRGGSLVSQIEHERESASEATDFEQAASLHKRLEKVGGVFRGLPEIIHRVDALSGVIVQRDRREKTVALFPVVNGIFAEPFSVSFHDLSQPQSMEEILREQFQQLQTSEDGPIDEAEKRDTLAQREEHLSIVARWFYSKPRAGEILFRDADWPYRRILRACARVLAAEEKS
jgi:excinuclease ABC subunit C